MTTTIAYPGSFDPITNGHVNLAARAARMFDRVLLAVASSRKKNPLFALDERVALARESLAHLPNVEVCGFDRLLVHFLRERGISLVLRGLRTPSEFEYEKQLASMNRAMYPEFDTLCMMPDHGLSYVSSSLVREVSLLGGEVEAFVPAPVNAALAAARERHTP